MWITNIHFQQLVVGYFKTHYTHGNKFDLHLTHTHLKIFTTMAKATAKKKAPAKKAVAKKAAPKKKAAAKKKK